MEELLNLTNLKSTITFMHLSGLALGIGGAWTLDAYLFKHLTRTKVTSGTFQAVEFISKLVTTGLIALWISGALFIIYYYYFTPEFLSNEKVWAKVFIVTILTVNGVFVHKHVLPKLKASIGKPLYSALNRKDILRLMSIGTISFVSWLIPMGLGVTKTLNFTVPGVYIIAAYFYALAIALLIAKIITDALLRNAANPNTGRWEFNKTVNG